MSFFDSLTEFPEDPIMSLPIHFAKDPRKNKVNLGIGTYRNAENQSSVLSSVKKAESIIYGKEPNKEYLPIEGMASFIQAVSTLVFGKDLMDKISGNTFSAQTIGGTSALFTGSKFLKEEVGNTIYIPQPTWPNHQGVFQSVGMNVLRYSYYDDTKHVLDFDQMCKDISKMPEKSIIILHASCHNPSGLDPSHGQWKELSALIKKQKILPFFDSSYQGFKESIDEDAFPIRLFASEGHEMLVASSYSKNFGLYAERVGSLHVICKNNDLAKKAGSQIKSIIRSSYSNPSKHGSAIIAEILNNEILKTEWLEELKTMRERLKSMRLTLTDALQAKGKKDWSFLKNQHGFFSFSGLDVCQVQRLIKDFAIYLQSNGRINVAGINNHNIDYIVDAITEVTDSQVTGK